MKTNYSYFAKDLLVLEQTGLDRTGIEQVGQHKIPQIITFVDNNNKNK